MKDAQIGESQENIESGWVSQKEDIWYPFMREKLLMEISKHLPHLVRKKIQIM